MPDLTAADMDAAVRTIAGTARASGIDVEGVQMAKLTKRMREIAEKVDADKVYGIEEAVGLLNELSKTKFKESFDPSSLQS